MSLTEKELVVKNFEKNFQMYKQKRIVLYGLGIGSKWIIENCKDYNILGLMDGYLTDGEKYGKPILSYDEVKDIHVDMIIIFCRDINLKLITERIAGFCLINSIRVFFQDGSEQKIKSSFHIDNRICGDFKENLRNELINEKNIVIECNGILFNDIFNNISKEASKCYFRNEMIEFINELIFDYPEIKISLINNQKKYSYLLPHLKKAFHDKVEIINNIYSFNDGVYITSSRGGNINKMKKIYVPQSSEMFDISKYKDSLNLEINDKRLSIMKNLFCNKAFNSPFVLANSDGRIHIKSAKEIGYLFFGPVILEFLEWFVDSVVRDNIDIIMFAARDGYIIQKLFKKICKNKGISIKSQYVYTSRICCIATGIYNEEDIKKTIKIDFQGSPKEMLLKRFMLNPDEILNEDINDKEQYILKHKDIIFKRSKELRNIYLNYLNELGFNKDKKIGFFDFVSSGTCHYYLNKILNCNMQGYYFYRFLSEDKEKNKLNIKAPYKNEGILAANSLVVESILTSFEPTFKYFDKNKNKFFCDEKRSTSELNYVKEVHEGIYEYFDDYINTLHNVEIDEKSDFFADKFLEFLYGRYTIIDNNEFNNYIVDDELHNQDLFVNNIYKY